MLLRQIDLLLGWFADVADVPVSADEVIGMPRNRLVARYASALEMAAWFLAKRAPDLRRGNDDGFAMLFDMNKLFQAFMGRMLRRTIPAGYRVREEGPRYFLTLNGEGERRFQMRPDFCILAGSEVVAIIDTNGNGFRPNRRTANGVSSKATSISCTRMPRRTNATWSRSGIRRIGIRTARTPGRDFSS